MSKKSDKDIKLKGLLPTLRQKKRFIVFKIESNKKFDFKEISYCIIDNLIKFLGTVDFGKNGVWLIREKYDKEKNIGIIKTSIKLKDKTIVALSLIENINNEDVVIKILGVSGTLKGCKKFIK